LKADKKGLRSSTGPSKRIWTKAVGDDQFGQEVEREKELAQEL
jgi:hypothetical protein